jgi:hypothetical protein
VKFEKQQKIPSEKTSGKTMNVENHGKLPLQKENIQCFLDELEKQNSLHSSIFPQFEASFSWHKKDFLFDRKVKKIKRKI